MFRDHPRVADGDHLIGIDRFERAADQIETAVEIGNLYRLDRFAAPQGVWVLVRSAMPDVIS